MKLNVAMRTQWDGTQRDYYEMRCDTTTTTTRCGEDETRGTTRQNDAVTRWNATTQQSNKQSGRGKMLEGARCNDEARRDEMRQDETKRDNAK